MLNNRQEEEMMESYIEWVKASPLLSAAIQFGILGTIGEIVSVSIVGKRFALPGRWYHVVLKVFAWALLGIIIKYGFTGMKGFTLGLLDHGLLPAFVSDGVGWAFAVSLFTNILFGPQMMFFHRLEDNLILWEWNMAGLNKAWWTLIWFWIPAHTITFSLPTEYQIGLASVWSVVLGLILGLSKARSTSPQK
jgi:hypothetical protein